MGIETSPAHHLHLNIRLPHRPPLACALALGILPTVCGGTARAATPSQPAHGFAEFQEDPDGGTVWQGKIPNPALPQAWRTTVVYLPPGFSRARRYPVVYLLQGLPGAPYQFVDSLALAARADPLIARGELRPFIAVMPPAGLTPRYDGEWSGVW